jgi:hypothetical protein
MPRSCSRPSFPQVAPLLRRFQDRQGELREVPLPVVLLSFMGTFFAYFLSHYFIAASEFPEHAGELDRAIYGCVPAWNHKMSTRLLSIVRKEFIQLFRDKRLLALILLVPLVQMVLLSYVFSNDLRDLPIAVFDQSHSVESMELLDAYQATDYFLVSYSVNTNAELTALIENGAVGVGLVIPPDYAVRLRQGQAQVSFIIDGSDPTIASTALSVAQLIAQNHATELMVQRARAQWPEPEKHNCRLRCAPPFGTTPT